MDSQHQHIFGLANQIAEANKDAELTHLLMLLYRHTREHFKAEEELMKQAAYPDYGRHIEQHDQMLTRLAEISESVQKKQWNPDAIKTFISNWILIHILEEDMRLADYLKQA